MTITFYKITNDKRDVKKTLGTGYAVSGTMRAGCNVVHPVFVVESISAIVTYNYCHIDEYHRYYFINEIKCVNDMLYEIHLEVDVLYTYRNLLLQHTAVIERQEGIVNHYLADGMYKKLEYETIGTFRFFDSEGHNHYLSPTEVNKPFILTVAGRPYTT